MIMITVYHEYHQCIMLTIVLHLIIIALWLLWCTSRLNCCTSGLSLLWRVAKKALLVDQGSQIIILVVLCKKVPRAFKSCWDKSRLIYWEKYLVRYISFDILKLILFDIYWDLLDNCIWPNSSAMIWTSWKGFELVVKEFSF